MLVTRGQIETSVKRRGTACLRAPNDRVNEDVFGFGLRDLAAEESWEPPMSVISVGGPAEHTVLESIPSSFIRVVVPVQTKGSNDS